MRNLFLTTCFLFGLLITTFPQQEKSPVADNDVHISKDHPTVYITFERFGKAINPLDLPLAEPSETSRSKEKGNDVWLRLHNNTRWAIRFTTWSMYIGKGASPKERLTGEGSSFKLGDGMEVSIAYGVEEPDGRGVRYTVIDHYTQSWLPSGRSVIFCVPRPLLSKERTVYVRFNYEWESEQPYAEGHEPGHLARFYGNNLRAK
jgi:hypothetical protein